MATTTEAGFQSDSWLTGMTKWRIPRPKMTHQRSSSHHHDEDAAAAADAAHQDHQEEESNQQRRPADPPKDYLSDSESEVAGSSGDDPKSNSKSTETGSSS